MKQKKHYERGLGMTENKKRFTWDWSNDFKRQVVTDHHNSDYEMMEKDCCKLLNELYEEKEELKQYKQSVRDVLVSYVENSDLTAKQNQIIISVMKELNVIE